MTNRRGPKTASAFVSKLAENAEYQQRMALQRENADAGARECADDERSLIAELLQAGVRVRSVWDFGPAGGAPLEAIPILLRHTTQPHHARIWDGIIRALTVKHAHDLALPKLVDMYCAERDEARRWVIANAIGTMAKFAEVQHLPEIEQYRPLFRQSRKPLHRRPAI